MIPYLLDTNILLRASDPGSSKYMVTMSSLAKLLAHGEPIYITAQNLIEFWAVATRPLSARGLGWNIAKTRTEIDKITRQFILLGDNADVFDHWLRLVTSYRVSGKQVHDARLVAVMQAYSINHILTFNIKDFRRYTAIITPVHPRDV